MEPITAAPGTRRVIVVEGLSDRHAVEALARRRGRDLVAEGIAVIDMAGVTNTFRYLEALGPHGADLAIRGLYDVGEERVVRRALERAGMGTHADRPSLAAAGFHACDLDLEDELIRALDLHRVPVALDAVLADGADDATDDPAGRMTP